MDSLGGNPYAWRSSDNSKWRGTFAKPDMERVFDLRQAGTKMDKSFNAKSANTKEFQFRQRVSMKEYQTRNFAGTKTAWQGDFKFSTKAARTTGKYAIPNSTKEADTKTMPVSDAREAGKTMATSGYERAERQYLKKGRSQDKFDKEGGVPGDNKPIGYSGDMKPMTIDDVRELLNKSK